MTYTAGDFEYRVAASADDPVVRDILARVCTGGHIQISFQREPNALDEPTGALAHGYVVARSRRSGEYVGLCERVVRQCFVNGEIRRLPYLGALRVVPGFRHRLAVLRGGFEAVRRLLGKPEDLGWSFTSIMSDNAVARRLLGANLRGMPLYEAVAEYSTYVLAARGNAECEHASAADLPEISELLLRVGARQQFTPAWTLPALRAALNAGLRPADFLLLRSGGRIHACTSLWDLSAHRQLIVSGYSRLLARVRPLINVATRLRGLPQLPPAGTRLANAYLSHLAVEEASAGDLLRLVSAACSEARRRGIALVLLGQATRHRFAAVLRSRCLHREYRSTLLTVRWPEDAPPQLDASLCVAPELALL